MAKPTLRFVPLEKRHPEDAKILAEVVASMETLGRFCFEVAHRMQNGFSAAYINESHNVANTFYQDILNLGTPDPDSVWQVACRFAVVLTLAAPIFP